MALVLSGMLVGVGTNNTVVGGSLNLLHAGRNTAEDGVNKLLAQDFWAVTGENFQVETEGVAWERADGYFVSNQDNLNVGCMLNLPNGVTITKVKTYGDIGANFWRLYRYPLSGIGPGDVMLQKTGVGSSTSIMFPVIDTAQYGYSIGASIDNGNSFTGVYVEYKI